MEGFVYAGNNDRVIKSYTPTFSFSDNTIPTVTEISALYTVLDNKLLLINLRFNITDKGTPGNNTVFRISLPTGFVPAYDSPAPIGCVYFGNGVSNLIIRTSGTTGNLIFVSGVGGGYSASAITTGNYSLFAILAVQKT